MSRSTSSFALFKKQLDTDLHTLANESRRRSVEVKEASSKSIEILKTVQAVNELENHPDFVVPFVLACKTRNAKMTTIAMQCLQSMSAISCIPKRRMTEVLDSFIEATHLAMDIQLKVLQIVPIFFETYAKYITGDLCKKLLFCCTSLLRVPNKAPVVAGTASATLQQLMDEIFDRLSNEKIISSIEDDDDSELMEVLVNNNETIKINKYRYDANITFSNLCSIVDAKGAEGGDETKMMLDVSDIPTDLGLEVLESILKNGKHFFIQFDDLQFLLRVKTIPLLLRCMSSSKHFSTVLRCFRCIRLLIDRDFLSIIELELEVILSLVIHNLSMDSSITQWQRVLSLEVFHNISQDPKLINEIYNNYDKFEDKKPVLHNFLNQCLLILSSEDLIDYVGQTSIIEKIDMPLISSESFSNKMSFMQMLDKSSAPNVNITYIIWLIIKTTNSWSEILSRQATEITEVSDKTKKQSKKKELHKIFDGLFEDLYSIHTMLLFSSTIDTNIFHSLVRAFQKLSHCAGLLGDKKRLERSLEYFRNAIIELRPRTEVSLTNDEIKKLHVRSPSGTGVLNTISDSLIGATTNTSTNESETTPFYTRNITSKNISLFRALISLAISLGPEFTATCWSYTFGTWDWMHFYLYGASSEFLNTQNINDIPPSTTLSRNDLISTENTIAGFLEATKNYPIVTLISMLDELKKLSDTTLNLDSKNHEGFEPFNDSGSFSYSAYNPSFFITQIADLTSANFIHILESPKGKNYWKVFVEYMGNLMSNRDKDGALRLYSSHVFSGVCKNGTNEIFEIEEVHDRNTKLAKYEIFLMQAFIDINDAIECLEITNREVHNGNLNVEGDIIFQILTTLKDQLNEFGDLIEKSWNLVFKIINSPFRWLKADVVDLLHNDIDDASLVEGIKTKQKNMIQVAYDVFKLISDDFLKSLPLEVIPNLIDTIVAFVNQEKILNISFSSISQFWLVGDYLRTNYSNITDDSDSDYKELNKPEGNNNNNDYLIELVTSQDISLPTRYHAIWLYLLKNLLFCAIDKRNEVSNGAIQTFFRIIDSHSTSFPAWKPIFKEVLEPFLSLERSDDELIVSLECLDITLKGMVTLFNEHYSDFSNADELAEEWIILLKLFTRLLKCTSTGVRFVAIKNYGIVVQNLSCYTNVPNSLLGLCAAIWTDYNIMYSDISNSSELSQKSEYDCVCELMLAFPSMCALIENSENLKDTFLEKSMGLFISAIKFPLLPEHSMDQSRPSTLQNAVLNGMTLVFQKISKEHIFLYFVQLSMMTTLIFGTRAKIAKKLAPKLQKTSMSRIPTFEAVCYKASELFLTQLDEASKYQVEPQVKYFIKICHNLQEIVVSKSLINISKDSSNPFWVLGSLCFKKLLTYVEDPAKLLKNDIDSQKEFTEIFMSIFLCPTERITDQIDTITENDDIIEFESYSALFRKNCISSMLKEDDYDQLVNSVWKASLIYELDDIQKQILDKSNGPNNPQSILSHLTDFEVYGQTRQQKHLTKHKLAIVCIKELLDYAQLCDKNLLPLAKITMPYLISRIALLLSKYIADEFLTGLAPIPKLRGEEMNILLKGLSNLLNSLYEGENASSELVTSLSELYPFILKTIPVSHKLAGLQDELLELSLNFTKLLSRFSVQ
ncbi:Protein MON2 [Nakaseomyces bracarensis]|uniref:Protein MON2 n=1 Tax=Nakaseomyces bracarensis TaxID=273131 RepID=A0ABR4NWS3_9SACH